MPPNQFKQIVLGSFIVLFRECFEAALIVGIILSFLNRTGQQQFIKTVTYGVIAAIFASIAMGVAFNMLSIEFEGKTEQIFEGITMLVTALLLSTMIVYMMRVKPGVKQIESEAVQSIGGGNAWGLFALVFFSVFREGVETVLFMIGLDLTGSSNGLLGGILGAAVGIGLVYLIFQGIIRLNFKMLFNVTNALLILIASGLVAHGIHELQEAGYVPIVIEHLWDINPALNADGSYPLFHEKGVIGALLAGVFGYNGNPSLIEVISYWVFMAAVLIAGNVKTGSSASAKQVAHS